MTSFGLVAFVVVVIVAASVASALVAGLFNTGVDRLIRRLVNKPDRDFERFKNGN